MSLSPPADGLDPAVAAHVDAGQAAASSNPTGAAQAPSNRVLLDQLTEDRLWLLRQIDAGRWSELRLDLAALERELGQMLDQAREKLQTD
ncbi:MAG: hypothetical protein DCF18_01890 [Cyanobium sp.]|uniref:hypothetical protein n=1 Tax=Synechococcus sp. CS-1333 TaxID=2848638 RepID=UPI000DBC2B1A|nr:hypothetical protein [Synechococcus sp. CS-1333]MCT0211498.1 hypothetical protein [Synechococcus sp. CS-1333]PZV24593.1 MAG: hypothetical protein DCF18_01890 [Cyanobium sp.]